MMTRPPSSHDVPTSLHSDARPGVSCRRLIPLIIMVSCVLPSLSRAEQALTPRPATQESEGTIATGATLMALDQEHWQWPQSAFKWIAMARDIRTPWDTFGREGWMTDDAYVEPVDPGVSAFSADTDVFYLVFAVSALDAPSQYRAAWFSMPDGTHPSDEMVGTDALTMDMNEKAGYLEIFRPEGGWQQGHYLLKLYFESPGQDLYEPNAIGTMTFTITD